jgi:hypothetical protein
MMARTKVLQDSEEIKNPSNLKIQGLGWKCNSVVECSLTSTKGLEFYPQH